MHWCKQKPTSTDCVIIIIIIILIWKIIPCDLSDSLSHYIIYIGIAQWFLLRLKFFSVILKSIYRMALGVWFFLKAPAHVGPHTHSKQWQIKVPIKRDDHGMNWTHKQDDADLPLMMALCFDTQATKLFSTKITFYIGSHKNVV